jgi:hypothetical protein
MSNVYYAENGQWVRDLADITPPTGPPPTDTTAFGMSVYVSGQSDAQAFAALETQFTRIPLIREYFQTTELLPTVYSDHALFASAYANGCKVWVISVKWNAIAGASSILAGGHDQEMANFFGSLPNDVLVYFSWYHEPDNDSLTSAQQTTYRNVWNYLAPKIRGYGHKTTLICTKFVLNKDPTGDTWRQYYVSSAIDVIGFDAYNVGRKSNPPKYTPASTIMGPIISLAQKEGKPWGIGETGSPLIPGDTGSQRAQWIIDCCNYCVNNDAAYYSYWNRVSLDGTIDYRISPSDTLSTNAYKGFLT